MLKEFTDFPEEDKFLDELDPIKELYDHSERFRSLVHRFCLRNCISIDEAFQHSFIRKVFDCYKKRGG